MDNLQKLATLRTQDIERRRKTKNRTQKTENKKDEERGSHPPRYSYSQRRVGHHYTQTHAHNIDKNKPSYKRTGSKNEPSAVDCGFETRSDQTKDYKAR